MLISARWHLSAGKLTVRDGGLWIVVLLCLWHCIGSPLRLALFIGARRHLSAGKLIVRDGGLRVVVLLCFSAVLLIVIRQLIRVVFSVVSFALGICCRGISGTVSGGAVGGTVSGGISGGGIGGTVGGGISGTVGVCAVVVFLLGIAKVLAAILHSAERLFEFLLHQFNALLSGQQN